MNEEEFIKDYLDFKSSNSARGFNCLDEQKIINYAKRELSKEERQSVEKHLASCNFCTEQLNLLFEFQKSTKEINSQRVPQDFISKAKRLIQQNGNILKFRTARKKRIMKNLFLIGTIISFIASFFFPKYFFQCLAAAIVLGVRWAFESESGRTLIMVIDSWRRHSCEDNDEISKRLKDRFNSFRP